MTDSLTDLIARLAAGEEVDAQMVSKVGKQQQAEADARFSRAQSEYDWRRRNK
ncbi:hypothetical protein [Corynebacterium glyciniphilum]|uniref:hypothetical protein n=1 Tax=Corynebacterium glyciniphilum TaxID=1404244 RepID=UPI003D9FFD1E